MPPEGPEELLQIQLVRLNMPVARAVMLTLHRAAEPVAAVRRGLQVLDGMGEHREIVPVVPVVVGRMAEVQQPVLIQQQHQERMGE
jgi:hypothetical protein